MSKEFNESVNVLFDKVEDLVSTKTVVGEAIIIGDITLLPLIEVSVGAGVGSNVGEKQTTGSGGGVGAKITPSAIMVIQNGTVQVMHLKNQDAISKLIDMAPGVINKLNFSSVFGDRNKKDVAPDVKFEEEVVVEEFEK